MIKHRVTEIKGNAEIIEKKSRFIAEVFPVKSDEEALSEIEKVRKQYWDARHHCYAYVLGENKEIVRCSDDGEPSGTAGKPILEAIMGEELTNTLVIVTRYFGGTLLGTGGLVRAYGKSAKEGILLSVNHWNIPGIRVKVASNYTDIGKIQYLVNQYPHKVAHTEYGVDVQMIIEMPFHEFELCKKELIEATSGACLIEEMEPIYFVDKQKAL